MQPTRKMINKTIETDKPFLRKYKTIKSHHVFFILSPSNPFHVYPLHSSNHDSLLKNYLSFNLSIKRRIRLD